MANQANNAARHTKSAHRRQREGVSAELLDNMFERFYRGDPSRNSATKGYGIGLSIAKAVVEAHKGRIVAESPDGKSMKITATLPTGQAERKISVFLA